VERQPYMDTISILIIDDDPNLRKTLTDIFRVGGYEPFSAGCGKEGLELLQRCSVCIALVDLKLPDISGLEVLEKIRTHHPRTETIILTGNATLDSAIDATNKGAFSYLQKPYEIDQLMLHIKRAVEKQQAEQKLSLYQEHLEELVRERTLELEKEVAERKRAEGEICKLNEDLRIRVRELEEAGILAEAGNRAKSDFLANMSHELTTPLNSVIGFSQLLLDGLYGELRDNQKEYVENILQSGRNLLTLIRDMLDLVSLDSAADASKASRFILKEALESSVAVFREEAIKHNLKLSLEIVPDADIELETRVDEFVRILHNLLSNAVKFTADGGSVSVTARRLPNTGAGSEAPSQDFIEISVADSGIGIRATDIPNIFNEISQLESPYTKKYGGIGVGLLLAKKLVERLGGRIRAESEYGRGSRFVFVIPCF